MGHTTQLGLGPGRLSRVRGRDLGGLVLGDQHGPWQCVARLLAHTAVNFTLTALPLITGRGLPSLWPATTGIGVLALLAIAITGGRLGHRTPDSPQATNPPSRPTATCKSEPFRA